MAVRLGRAKDRGHDRSSEVGAAWSSHSVRRPLSWRYRSPVRSQRHHPSPTAVNGRPARPTQPIRRAGAPGCAQADQLLHRLHGVLVARRYVMLAYDVPANLLERASALTPGIESPTISPLHREGWVAVQAMVARDEVHRIMDELYEVGARAILVTNIHACRL